LLRRVAAQYDSVHWNAHLIAARAKIFFIIFVDGMFTTFIARLFTNISEALRRNPATSCV
jgi:hypothetical protein